MRKTFRKKVLEYRKPVNAGGRFILYFCVFFLGTSMPFISRGQPLGGTDSQQQSFTLLQGRVTDVKGHPLPGVTLRFDGTSRGGASDNEGNFTLRAYQREGVLIVSCIGYKTQKVSFQAGKFLLIRLEENISELDEVQVIAYGTQRKREVIASISTVKAEDIKDIPSPSIANLLQGRVAGMNVINSSGSPGGGGINVTIRGFNSLSVEAGRRYSDPLWVIDGIPVQSFTSPVTGTNSLAEIDPNDIESIQVLKDAAAGAIYGSRAANGVILVTTKKGNKNQKARFTVNVSHTMVFKPKLPELTGGNAERHLRMEALRNYQTAYYDAETNTYKYPDSYIEAYRNRVPYDFFWNEGNGAAVKPYQDSLNPFYNNSTNLFDYYFRTARVTDANLQISGGSEKIAYNVGLGYYTERGVLRKTGFDRVKLMTNLYFQPLKNMEANLRFYLSRTGRKNTSRTLDNDGGYSAVELEEIPSELLTTSTILPGPGTSAFEEVIKRYEKTLERNETYRLRSSFDLAYEFIRGLRFKSSLALDYSQHQSNYFKPSDIDQYGDTYSAAQLERFLMLLNENILSYKQTFREAHSLELLAGIAFQSDENNLIKGWGKRAPSDLIHYVTWQGNVYDVEDNRNLKDFMTGREKSTMVGIFGRISYNYKQKYLASITVRRDASSKFGENTRWGTFPSYALGYAFSEEKFMQGIKNVLDYGKIRVSFGKSGRQFEQPYIAYGVLGPGDSFMGHPTVYPNWEYGLINRKLTWEETKQWDVGLDLDFFNYRFGVVVDYYHRLTDKLLYLMPLPGNYSGFFKQWGNYFAIANSGLEIQLKGILIRKENVDWTLTFNIARNWNRLKKSTWGRDFQTARIGFVSAPSNINVIGKPLNGILAYRTDGVYQNDNEVPFCYINGRKRPLGVGSLFYRAGDRIILDYDGNGRIGTSLPLEEDRVYCGSPLPIAQGGIVSTLNWKGFDLNLLFNYVIGRHILNAGKGASLGTYMSAFEKELTKPVFADLSKVSFWQKPGDRADYPANRLEDGLMNFSTYLSSNIEKVNYLKLKTLTLGYTLPVKWKEKLGFGARIFISAENLFTITNYSGPDPESVDIITGVDNLTNYPLATRVTFGLTLKL